MTHPSPETLAEFIDGKLAGETRDAVVEHIEECDDCLLIVGETARLFDEAPEGIERRSSRHHTPRMLFAAAMTGIVLMAGWFFRDHTSDAVTKLARASLAVGSRPVEGRVAGFPYVPFRRPRSADNSPDIASLRMQGIAGNILAETRSAIHDGDKQHAAGIAALMAGNISDAVTYLKRATALKPEVSAYWNDLAAAWAAAAESRGDPQQYADALSAADHALMLNPTSLEALFNRARILESMNALRDAVAAYDRYLALDSESDWAHEARHRRAQLQTVPRSERWEIGRPQLERAVRLGDVTTVRRIVGDFREEARLWGELIYLGRWAEATERHDPTAEDALRVAEAIGNALRDATGESLLLGGVRAIKVARDSPVKTAALIRGHKSYQQARSLYSRRDVTSSAPLFEEATAALEKGGSPMALVSNLYSAQIFTDTERTADAQRLAESLLGAPSQFRALRAQVQWVRGTLFSGERLLRDQIAVQTESLAIYDELGEPDNASRVRSAIAGAETLLGERAQAWRTRVRMFRDVSDSGITRSIQSEYSLAARTESLTGHWETAYSLLSLALEPPNRANVRVTQHAFLWRALVANRLGWPDAAFRDIAEGRRAMAQIPDAFLRSLGTSDLLFAESVAVRNRDPKLAASFLTTYLRDAESRHERHLVAEAHLERARALLAEGLTNEAARDFRAAIPRASPGEDEAEPAAYFSTRDSAIRELVDLLDTQGDVRGAFALLSDEHGPQQDRHAELPAGVLLARYITLPTRLLIFTSSGDRLNVYRVAMSADRIRVAIDALTDTILGGRPSEVQAAAVARIVLSPIAVELERASRLVIHADETTASVPFAMLPDGSGPLIDRLPISFVDSPAAATSPDKAVQPRTLLSVGNPTVDPSLQTAVADLPAARTEAEEIGRMYGQQAITGPKASKLDVIRALHDANIVHIAAHAIANGTDPAASALLLAPAPSGSGALSAREIEAMKFRSLELVVLSACRTASSSDRAGRSDSLAIAFLRAGAQRVIASLWNMDDEPSRAFANYFHREISQGQPACLALRTAQLRMLHSGDKLLRDPRAWSGLRIYLGTRPAPE